MFSVRRSSDRWSAHADGDGFAQIPGRDSDFASASERTEELLVPSLTLHEVFKRELQQRDEGQALQAVAVTQQERVVELDDRPAPLAGRISVERKLPMADSVILATARAFGATVWTQDDDFKGLPAVQFRPRRP
jgi:predicted nucleic acid-binding protein